MSGQLTLLFVTKLVSLVVILNASEMLQLFPVWSNKGVWQWHDLMPARYRNNLLFKSLWTLLYHPVSFSIFQLLAVTLGFLIFIGAFPRAIAGLFVIHFITVLRFRGSFNGASDTMLLMLLFVLTVAWFNNDHSMVVRGCLWFIALQGILSYLRAGLAKLANPQWRQGEALRVFLNSPLYESPRWLKPLIRHSHLLVAISWLIMLFEITFWVAILHPITLWLFLFLGLLFHSANIYLFALRRFFLTWLSTYPTFYFAQKELSQFL